MQLPSKELLSEVLQDSILAVGITKFDDLSYTTNESYIDFYTTDNELYYNINIYELAHKCKEWAYELGYNIMSGYGDLDYDGDTCESTYKIYSVINLRCGYHSYNSTRDKDDWCNDTIFDMNTSESEAIFKACQWILDNKDKQ